MTAYEQGFMDKCAELGVDPSVLVKLAVPMNQRRITRRDILRAVLEYEDVKSDADAHRYGFDGVNTVGDLKKIIKHKVTPNGQFAAEAIMGDPKSWAMRYYMARRRDGTPAVTLAGD